MKTIRILSTAFLLAPLAVAGVGVAQAQPAAAKAPTESASMPKDCPKPMAKHSHAAEKGEPVASSKSGPCAPMASATPSKDKTRHYHPRDAKNQ